MQLSESNFLGGISTYDKCDIPPILNVAITHVGKLSQLPPIGPTEMSSWLQHTLAWYWVSLDPPKGPVLAQNAPFGDPGGHWRAPIGPDLVPTAANRSVWVRLMVTTHLGLILGLFMAAKGPKGGNWWKSKKYNFCKIPQWPNFEFLVVTGVKRDQKRSVLFIFVGVA